jgi:hypothetical protein
MGPGAAEPMFARVPQDPSGPKSNEGACYGTLRPDRSMVPRDHRFRSESMVVESNVVRTVVYQRFVEQFGKHPLKS